MKVETIFALNLLQMNAYAVVGKETGRRGGQTGQSDIKQ